MGDYIYYPGCSLEGSARAYASSLSAIVAPLGVKLHEIDDWNCCGATEYMTLSPLRGHALIARNLALAEAQRDGASTLVAPCSACYVNLAKTDRYYRESSGFAELVNKALSADNLHYDGGALHVRHLLEVLVDDVGVDEIAAHVTRPLKGLRVAPYLGCLVSRPDLAHRWGDHEQPHALDRLMTALWADMLIGIRPPDLDQIEQTADLYLLADIDIPWADDGTRYFPGEASRKRFYGICRKELEKRELPFVEIKGKGDARLQAAIAAVNMHFSQVLAP